MDKWINVEKYLEINNFQSAVIEQARQIIRNAHEMADKCPPPKKHRPAVASDIVEGAIIWNEYGDEGHYWNIVSKPLHYGDPFKAYMADDGCRYGLDGAYIALPDPPKEATDG